MKNKKALEFFENMSLNTKDQQSVKLANVTDLTQIDADFIMQHCGKESSILDLGSGTGLIINKIYDKVRNIVAVEPFSAFTEFIVNSPNVKIVNKTFEKFSTEEKFDCVTIFGTMHYFNEQEAIKIYTKFFDNIKNRGKLIIKNQFGVTEDVTVDGYSEEQKTNYFAQYRFIDNEVKILQKIGFKSIQVVDIYPPESNRWTNTHFYAIVASKH